MPEYLFVSERLGFRGWSATDLPLMTRLNGDPRVMRHFPATLSAEQSESFIARLQAHQARHGYCYYAADLLATGACIGFIGLAWQEYEAGFTPCTDIGWRLIPEAWGKGLATEGARACLDQAFGPLGLQTMVATAAAVNLPSIAVMKRLGMQYVQHFVHPRLQDNERLRDCVLYRINGTSS